MPAPWRRRACSAPIAQPIASPMPSATSGAGWWFATPSSGRARVTSPSSAPCSGSTATACPPAARRTLSSVSRACPCRAAVLRPRAAARPHASPQPAARILRRADRVPRRPRSPRAAPALRPLRRPRHRRRRPRRGRRRLSASATRINSKPNSASCPANTAPVRLSAAAPSPKTGNSRTHWLLIQAAVSILRRHPPQAEHLRTWALRIAARRGKQVAVVALARRLAGILYALLRDGSVFGPQRARPPRPTAAALANV